MLGRGALLGIERGEEGSVLIGRRCHDESEPWSGPNHYPGIPPSENDKEAWLFIRGL
jgi:hypothetical protein